MEVIKQIDEECSHDYGSEMVQWVCGITEPHCLKCLKPQQQDGD